MQTAANINRFLTSYSSRARFAEPEIVVSRNSSIQHLVVSHLAQTVYSQDALLKLANALIQFAEQAYILRDLSSLQEASQVLTSLPMDAARQIGLYYHALAIKRDGKINEAQKLFEAVADNAPADYRVRAIQGLSAIHHCSGQLDEALRFQLEALRACSSEKTHGLQTTLIARHGICIIQSLNGDHKGALSGLKRLGPLVKAIAKQKLFYFYVYCNALAIDLGELGRIPEAQAVSAIALASPFASAYPEWSETRDEIAAKRISATPSVVAINRAPQADSAPQAQPQPESEPLKLTAT